MCVYVGDIPLEEEFPDDPEDDNSTRFTQVNVYNHVNVLEHVPKSVRIWFLVCFSTNQIFTCMAMSVVDFRGSDLDESSRIIIPPQGEIMFSPDRLDQ